MSLSEPTHGSWEPSKLPRLGRIAASVHKFELGKWQIEHGKEWMTSEQIDAMWESIVASVLVADGRTDTRPQGGQGVEEAFVVRARRIIARYETATDTNELDEAESDALSLCREVAALDQMEAK